MRATSPVKWRCVRGAGERRFGSSGRTRRCAGWRAKPRGACHAARASADAGAARPWADLRRTLRESARNDGEVMRLGRLKRRPRPRKMLLLIDVSGSMKSRSETISGSRIRVQATQNIEVFTFGTRLTRVTHALRLKRREQALAAAAHLVSDWDGGTRRRRAAGLSAVRPRRLRSWRRRRRRVPRAGADLTDLPSGHQLSPARWR